MSDRRDALVRARAQLKSACELAEVALHDLDDAGVTPDAFYKTRDAATRLSESISIVEIAIKRCP